MKKLIIFVFLLITIVLLAGCKKTKLSSSRTLEKNGINITVINSTKKILENQQIDSSDYDFKNNLVFLIIMDNHEYDLSVYDLKQLSSLNINDRPVKPLKLDNLSGPSDPNNPMGSHHQESILVFKKPVDPDRLILKIKEVGEINEWSFNFLKKS